MGGVLGAAANPLTAHTPSLSPTHPHSHLSLTHSLSHRTLMISTSWSTPLPPLTHPHAHLSHTLSLSHTHTLSHRTLMISTSWSTPLSPGNSGCPSISSATTQPTDQTSIALV